MSVEKLLADRQLARIEIFAALCRVNSASAAWLRTRSRLVPNGNVVLDSEIAKLDKLIAHADPDNCRAHLDSHIPMFERLADNVEVTRSGAALLRLGERMLPLLRRLRTCVHLTESYPLDAQKRARAIDAEGALQ